MVHFVGAGSGAPDLITVRGQRLIAEADVIIYAGSLVNRALLDGRREGCRVYDSAKMTLEEVADVMRRADKENLTIVRLHTGDPSLYGAVREQMDILEREGIPYDVTPGVSSLCGAASALKMEYTLPGVSQSVVVTRMEGRTPVPEKESIEAFAAHGATMVIFLSAGMPEELSRRLVRGGYAPDTPAAIVYKATWPDEEKYICTVGSLAETAAAHGITKTALIIVGGAVAQSGYERSSLYDPGFTTAFRKGREAAGAGAKAHPGGGAAGGSGKVTVIGMGPGRVGQMTMEAYRAIEESDVIAGYRVYVDLIRDRFPGKKIITTAMRREEERCALALREAADGADVAFVCSGDAGVYGMAGLIYEMAQAYPSVEIRVIPGVTAALSGAALLGAPLIHDFVLISLSDLMTPWEKIEKRLRMAAEGDFVIVLYNPSSKKRADYLRRACDILMETLPPEQVCGTVRNIGREGETAGICTLAELRDLPVDMFTTVFIGNRSTRRIGDKMVTPRGYARERKAAERSREGHSGR
jgi:precorrin-4 C11-methyltransferase